MQKRTINRVTIETASWRNIQTHCQQETPFTARFPVACTGKVMYHFDEPVYLRVLFIRPDISAGIIAYFVPDWTDFLTIKVNETLPDTQDWKIIPELIFETLTQSMTHIHEICGGTLFVVDTRSQLVESSKTAFKLASQQLMRALQADWANGTDAEIANRLE